MTRVSTDELAAHLSDILERVAAEREQFVVEDHGVAVAVIQPPVELSAPTMHQLAALLSDVPWPDPEYFDDIETARREVNVPIDLPKWP